MVGFALGNDTKFINAEYHAVRNEAKRETASLLEWGDPDITDYDLDNLTLGGEEFQGQYRISGGPITGETSKSYDLRTLDDR